MNRSWSVVILTSLVVLAAGCFPDYERFRGVGGADAASGGEDAGVEDASAEDSGGGGEEVGADAGADAEVVEDVAPDDAAVEPDAEEDAAVEPDAAEDAAVGMACASDAACPSGQVCLEGFDGGFCSVACVDDSACPSGSACGASVGLAYCLLPCAGSCARAGFSCVAGWRGGEEDWCVTDSDGDGALNAEDVCPEVFDPEQSDVDHDGDGDRCDVDPYCPLTELRGTSSQGYDRASPPGVLRGGGMVYVPPLRQVLYLGGEDGQGGLSDRVVGYDGGADAWSASLPPLPYAARGVAAAWDRQRQEVVATPGEGAGRRLLVLPVEAGWGGGVGAWRLGPALDAPLYHAAIAPLFPDRFVIAGFTAPTRGEGAELVAYLYDRSGERLRRLAGSFAAVTDEEVTAPLLTTHRDGRVYLLNPNRRTLYWVIDPVAGTLDTANNAQGVPTLTPALFNAAGDPPALPLVGGATSLPFSYFIRLDTGDAQRIDVQQRQARSSALSIPVPTGVELEGARFEGLFIQEGLSILALTTPAGGGGTTAREYFPLCERIFTGDDVDDEDGDTLGALRDNCVGSSGQRNRDQADHDRDGIGDICDDDLDGDGIPNAQDLVMLEGGPLDLRRDMDNDRLVDTDDDDDDGDGIPDAEDPYPADSDNDGVPNALDPDDDDDGTSDIEEQSAGSSQVSWFSIPGLDRVVLVTAEPSPRLLLTSLRGLADGEAPQVIPTPEGVRPAQPRLRSDGRWLVYLDVADAAAPRLVAQDLQAAGDMLEAPLVLPMEGRLVEADLGAVDQLEAFLVIEVDGVWQLERRRESAEQGPLAAVELLISSPQPLSGVEISPSLDLIFFVEEVQGCSICADLLLLELTGVASPQRLLNDDIEGSKRSPRLSAAGDVLAFLAGPQDAARAWILRGGIPTPISPEGWEILSLSFGQSSRRAVLSARRVGTQDAPRLFVADTVTEVWRPLGEVAVQAIASP